MGVRDDLAYFGPRMGFARAVELFARKASKRYCKRALAAELRLGESDERLLARLGLSADPAERRHQLLEQWTPLRDLGASRGRAAEPSEVARRARAVSEGRQRLFGQELGTGIPPMWEWRWLGRPEAPIFREDVRSTWEVQRLQGLLPLARGARLEAAEVRGHDPERMAEAWVESLVSFARTHPGPDGIAWESALEVGLRLVALVQALPMVAGRDAFHREDLVLLRVLDRHARWLAVDLSTDKVVRGNHLLGELAGLVAAGYLAPAARGTWWGNTRPGDLLAAEILRQVHPDGVSVEQSLTYEKFVLEFLLVALRAGELRGEPPDAIVRERLLALVDHLETCTAPEGALPRVGDCDSGRGADWGEEDPHAPGEVLERARLWLGASAPGPLSGEPESPRAPGDPPAGDPAAPSVRHFPEGGHLVLRAGEPGREDFLFVRGGPFGWGIPGPASHSHCDLLCPEIHLGGEPILVDPGVYGYRVGPELREGFRGWEAHNGLALDPPAAPHPSGTFRWRGLPPPASLGFTREGAEVEIHGEAVLQRDGISLRWHRAMRYNGLRRMIRIRDRIGGGPSGPVTWAFHFAAGTELEASSEPGTLTWRRPSGPAGVLRVRPAAAIRIEEGWVAPSYGRRLAAPVARFRLDSCPEAVEITLEATSGSETD